MEIDWLWLISSYNKFSLNLYKSALLTFIKKLIKIFLLNIWSSWSHFGYGENSLFFRISSIIQFLVQKSELYFILFHLSVFLRQRAHQIYSILIWLWANLKNNWRFYFSLSKFTSSFAINKNMKKDHFLKPRMMRHTKQSRDFTNSCQFFVSKKYIA